MSAPTPKVYLHCEDAGGISVVTFTIEHLRDERIIRSVFDSIDAMIADGRNRIIINFTGLLTFASFAIGKLIMLEKTLSTGGGRLALCCLTPIVEEIVDIMNLRKRFQIYATERDALESFV